MKKIGKPSRKSGSMSKGTSVNNRVAPKSSMKTAGNVGRARTGMPSGKGKGATGF